MNNLRDRLIQLVGTKLTDAFDNRGPSITVAELVDATLIEIESKHRIIDPDTVTEEMLDACFEALPEHYDPPDPKRRAWHGFKAKRRYSAMIRRAPKAY